MNALQKIKLSKELLGLTGSLKSGQLKALEKIKASKRALELAALLGGEKVAAIAKDYSALFNDILTDSVNVFTAKEKLTELHNAVNDLGGDDMPDGDNKELLIEAIKQAAMQVFEGRGYQLAA